MLELILDFLPWSRRSRDRTDEVVGKLLGGAITVRPRRAGAIEAVLFESGWLDEEVLAAGDLRQGKEPTVLSMMTGLVLIELLRPRRSRSLPRHFVLAVTRDRVVAFAAVGGGDDSVDNGPYEVSIRPGERASWPRESVRLTDLREGSRSRSATLILGGTERVPVWRSNPTRSDPCTDDLLELLGS